MSAEKWKGLLATSGTNSLITKTRPDGEYEMTVTDFM